MTVTLFVLIMWTGFNIGLVAAKRLDIPDWVVSVSLCAAIIFGLVI